MRRFLLPLALVALTPTPAVAQDVVHTDSENGIHFSLPQGWAREPQEGMPATMLARYTNKATSQLAVLMRIPMKKTPRDARALDEFAAGVESGMKNKSQGYKRISLSKRTIPGALATLDYWFTIEVDGAQQTMGARYLIFDGYGIGLIVDSRTAAGKATARRIIKSFVPNPPRAKPTQEK